LATLEGKWCVGLDGALSEGHCDPYQEHLAPRFHLLASLTATVTLDMQLPQDIAVVHQIRIVLLEV